jgi:hypothetical protein
MHKNLEEAPWETRTHTGGLYDNDRKYMWLLWTHYCNLKVYKMPGMMDV